MLTKFRLLLMKEALTFIGFPLAVWLGTLPWPGLSDPARRIVATIVFGTGLGLLMASIEKRLRRLPDSLTESEMRLHAMVTFMGYLLWIAAVVCAAIVLRDRVWVLAVLIVPVLAVFCYGAVRTNLGLEPLMGSKPPSQPLQQTEKSSQTR